MKVFICWSGDQSKKLGEALRKWLPSVLQRVEPYFTPNDIEKGARWFPDISKELDESAVGVLCLTKSNLESPWLMFESGALSKKLERSRVCPLLFGVDNSELKGPLVQFQATAFAKDDMKKLISTLNELCGNESLEDAVVDEVFEMWWGRLEQQVNEILEAEPSDEGDSPRADRDILNEVLELSRLAAAKSRAPRAVNPAVAGDLKRRFDNLCASLIDFDSPEDIGTALFRLSRPIGRLCGRFDTEKDDLTIGEIQSRLGDVLGFCPAEPGEERIDYSDD